MTAAAGLHMSFVYPSEIAQNFWTAIYGFKVRLATRSLTGHQP
jgi:hypothetical protein